MKNKIMYVKEDAYFGEFLKEFSKEDLEIFNDVVTTPKIGGIENIDLITKKIELIDDIETKSNVFTLLTTNNIFDVNKSRIFDLFPNNIPLQTKKLDLIELKGMYGGDSLKVLDYFKTMAINNNDFLNYLLDNYSKEDMSYKKSYLYNTFSNGVDDIVINTLIDNNLFDFNNMLYGMDNDRKPILELLSITNNKDNISVFNQFFKFGFDYDESKLTSKFKKNVDSIKYAYENIEENIENLNKLLKNVPTMISKIPISDDLLSSSGNIKEKMEEIEKVISDYEMQINLGEFEISRKKAYEHYVSQDKKHIALDMDIEKKEI